MTTSLTSDPNSTHAPSSQPSSPPTKRSHSPPYADTVIRPFTSQGSTFSSPHAFNYPPPPLLSSSSHPPRPPHPHSHYDDSQLDPPSKSTFGPYTSASARTSYTRVDVDSLTAPTYPPLPSLPSTSNEPVPSNTNNTNADDTEPPASVRIPTSPAMMTTDGSQHNVATSSSSTSAEPPIPQTPQVSLTFLLVSGRRKTQSFDPETTIGRVKELVWNAWPGRDLEWQDERPPAPSYLRILYLGRILQDDETLLRIGFPTSLPTANTATATTSPPVPTPTIVHLSIRPYAPPSDDPALNKKRKLNITIGRRASTATTTNVTRVGVAGRDGETSVGRESAGCCSGCVIC